MWGWKDFFIKDEISGWRKGRFQCEEGEEFLARKKRNLAKHMGDLSVRKEVSLCEKGRFQCQENVDFSLRERKIFLKISVWGKARFRGEEKRFVVKKGKIVVWGVGRLQCEVKESFLCVKGRFRGEKEDFRVRKTEISVWEKRSFLCW